MAINPYATVANAAALFGPNDAQQIANAGARAQREADRLGGQVQRTIKKFPGIPGVGGRNAVGNLASRAGASSQGARPNVGSTITRLTQQGGNAATRLLLGDVVGMPSLRLVELPNGGVEARLVRRSPWMDYFTPADFRELERILGRVLSEARRLSRGRLSYEKLAAMNHPYGHGPFAPGPKPDVQGPKRKALPKTLPAKRLRQMGAVPLNVVNKHTGDFLAAWSDELRLGRGQVVFVLRNDIDYAKYLAFGTPKMKAHGPFAVVFAMYQPQIDIAFRGMARKAYMRAQAGAHG